MPALDHLEQCRGALDEALSGNDPAAIERSGAAFAAAIADLAADGPAPSDADRLRALIAQADDMQRRVNFLTDATRRRLDGIAAGCGRPADQTYAPSRQRG